MIAKNAIGSQVKMTWPKSCTKPPASRHSTCIGRAAIELEGRRRSRFRAARAGTSIQATRGCRSHNSRTGSPSALRPGVRSSRTSVPPGGEEADELLVLLRSAAVGEEQVERRLGRQRVRPIAVERRARWGPRRGAQPSAAARSPSSSTVTKGTPGVERGEDPRRRRPRSRYLSGDPSAAALRREDVGSRPASSLHDLSKPRTARPARGLSRRAAVPRSRLGDVLEPLPLPPHFDAEPGRRGLARRLRGEVEEAERWRSQRGSDGCSARRLRVALVVVDVQNTFCMPGFELFVAGRSGTRRARGHRGADASSSIAISARSRRCSRRSTRTRRCRSSTRSCSSTRRPPSRAAHADSGRGRRSGRWRFGAAPLV